MELTTDLVIQDQTYQNKTYQLSETKIEGFVDELEALKQSIYKDLATERYEHPIYGFGYGVAWKQLIGEDPPYVRAEMKRMIQETLLRDSRILDVDGFEFEFSGDTCHCAFQVQSIYGEVEIEKEAEI